VWVVTPESIEQKDLRDYLRPVLKRWWLLAIIVPVVTIGTYLYYDHKPKVYGASTQLFVQPSPVNALLSGGSSSVEGLISAENVAVIIQTRTVGEKAAKLIAKQHVDVSGGSVTAEALEKTQFVSISATAATPQGAAALANAYAKAFLATQAKQLAGEANRTLKLARRQLAALPLSQTTEAKREALQEEISTLELVGSEAVGNTGIKVVERAFPSATPMNHNPRSNAIFAFVLSILLSIGAAYLLEYMTRKVGSVEDAEEIYGLPVLAEVPKVDDASPQGPGGIGVAKELHEPFHRLQMNLDMLSAERELRTILVVSAAPGEGKSIVTRNLGLLYREAGRNAAVLDADFRKRTLGGLMNAHDGPGLTDILAGRATFGQAVQEVAVPNGNGNGAAPVAAPVPQQEPNKANVSHGDLAMVPAGGTNKTLAAELSGGRMGQTIVTASELYDRVIVDSSPVLATADVLPLLSEVDGVVVVTRLGVSTRESAKRMLKELERVPNINLVGVVVNGIPQRMYRTRAYGYYYG
jgi:Mrp family chromosome partitioning ATPase/capsular polysaccharide biosynthesis protein